MATKAKMGRYSRAFLGRDSSKIRGFNLADFAVSGENDPAMPYEVEAHIDAVLSGRGLRALLKGEWVTDSDSRMSLTDLPSEIKQWAQARITEADRYIAARELARATAKLQEHFAGPYWYHLALVWDELTEYPQLRAQYEQSHGIIVCPHDFVGYAIHAKGGKFLVKGLYRKADIKHMHITRGTYDFTWQYEAGKQLDNGEPLDSWQKHHIGAFDTQAQAQEFISVLRTLHIQVRVRDFAKDTPPPHLALTERIAQLIKDFYDRVYEIKPGQVHGPYTVLSLTNREGFGYPAWACRHEEHGEINPDSWRKTPYWLTEGELRQEHFTEEVGSRIFTPPAPKKPRKKPMFRGYEGQDRQSYTDTQDRESYQVNA